ncbi:NrsF family protein [Brevundimonas vesicularis]|uniref:NrsF family protein n=1 Tax=Brevundimonas vesicularis TaxID=41276 RepID=UPI00384B06BC
MKTDDLIDALAAGIEPTGMARLDSRLLGVAAAIAVLAVALLLDIRPDLLTALGSPTPWVKGGYIAGLCAASVWLATRLGRPGTDPRRAVIALVLIVAFAVAWGGAEIALTRPDLRLSTWLGNTWTVCGRNIVMVSLLAGPLVFLSARKLAPTRPVAAGVALGLVTGGLAATAYGVLHCDEATAAFVATWYTLGVAAAGVCGGIAGRFALRW